MSVEKTEGLSFRQGLRFSRRELHGGMDGSETTGRTRLCGGSPQRDERRRSTAGDVQCPDAKHGAAARHGSDSEPVSVWAWCPFAKNHEKNKWFRLWRKKLPKNKWFQRGAWVGEFGLSSAFEGIEELSQDVIDANALGDEIDREALKWSFLVGSASGGIYHAGGSALKRSGQGRTSTSTTAS